MGFHQHARDIWEFIWMGCAALMLFVICLAAVMFLQSIRFEGGGTALEVIAGMALFFGLVLLFDRFRQLRGRR